MNTKIKKQAERKIRNSKLETEKILGFFLLFSLIFILSPETSFANSYQTEVGSVEDFGEYVSKVWGWAAEVIFGVSVLALVVGGLLMMSAGGDEEKASMGRQTIKGSVISAMIVLFSAVLQRFLQQPTQNIDGVAQLSDTSEVINNSINVLLVVVGGMAAAGLVLSGLRLVTSGGDEEKIESAKKGIKMSIFGLIISIAAWGVLQFLISVWR